MVSAPHAKAISKPKTEEDVTEKPTQIDRSYLIEVANALSIQRAMLDKLERVLRDAGEYEAEQLVLELKLAEAALGFTLSGLVFKHGSKMFPQGVPDA